MITVQQNQSKNSCAHELCQKREPLDQLWKSSEQWFLDPLPLTIIEAASCPRIASDHMAWLGWGYDITMGVFNGAKIKNQYPGTWGELKQANRRPSIMLDMLMTPSSFDPCLQIDRFLKVGDTTIDQERLPFFMHNFQLVPSETKGQSVNSVGGPQGNHKSIGKADSGSDDNLTGVYAFPHTEAYYNHKLGNGTFYIRKGMSYPFYEWVRALDSAHPDTWKISGKLLFVTPPQRADSTFPRLCKVVEIRQVIDGQGFERVRIQLRQDMGPHAKTTMEERGSKQTCWVTYVKEVPLAGNLRASLTIPYAYEFEHGYISSIPTPMADRKHYKTPPEIIKVWAAEGASIGCLSNLPASDFAGKNNHAILGELLSTAQKMWAAQTPPPLETLAGIQLTESQPQQLSELFY
jgi:hypothetical protein